jgi:hypothetical protein
MLSCIASTLYEAMGGTKIGVDFISSFPAYMLKNVLIAVT